MRSLRSIVLQDCQIELDMRHYLQMLLSTLTKGDLWQDRDHEQDQSRGA